MILMFFANLNRPFLIISLILIFLFIMWLGEYGKIFTIIVMSTFLIMKFPLYFLTLFGVSLFTLYIINNEKNKELRKEKEKEKIDLLKEKKEMLSKYSNYSYLVYLIKKMKILELEKEDLLNIKNVNLEKIINNYKESDIERQQTIIIEYQIRKLNNEIEKIAREIYLKYIKPYENEDEDENEDNENEDYDDYEVHYDDYETLRSHGEYESIVLNEFSDLYDKITLKYKHVDYRYFDKMNIEKIAGVEIKLLDNYIKESILGEIDETHRVVIGMYNIDMGIWDEKTRNIKFDIKIGQKYVYIPALSSFIENYKEYNKRQFNNAEEKKLNKRKEEIINFIKFKPIEIETNQMKIFEDLEAEINLLKEEEKINLIERQQKLEEKKKKLGIDK